MLPVSRFVWISRTKVGNLWIGGQEPMEQRIL